MNTTFSPNRTIGKYRLAALAKGLDNGRWRASISIRSGHGSASTDRVLRLCDSFDNEGDAQRHALAQGLAWVAERSRPLRIDNPRFDSPQADSPRIDTTAGAA